MLNAHEEGLLHTLTSYIRYCRSEVVTIEQATHDFFEIIHTPQIMGACFSKEDPPWFVFAVRHVVIKDKEGFPRAIGEFIVKILREGQIAIWNTSPMGPDGGPREGRQHPHVNQEGNICIQGGRDMLNAAIREGRLLYAVKFLIQALHTSGPGYPFLDITSWPVARITPKEARNAENDHDNPSRAYLPCNRMAIRRLRHRLRRSR